MKEIDDFLRNWTTKKKWRGKKIDEILQIDGIPLWSFYHRSFTSHVMPKHLNTFPLLEKKKSLTKTTEIFLAAKAAMLRKYLLWNEQKKIHSIVKKEKNGENQPAASADKENDDKEKILFLSYTDHLTSQGTVFRIQPLIDKIKKDGICQPFLLLANPLSSAKHKKLQRQGAKQNTIYQYYSPEIEIFAKEKSATLSQAWKDIPEAVKNEFFTLEEQNIWPYLKPAFSFFFSPEMIYVTALYYEIAKKILRQEKIRTVVLTSQSGFFEKCFLAAAAVQNTTQNKSKAKIPVFQIQHGIGSGALDTSYATKRLIFSDFHKKELLTVGVDEENIFITGPIIFDEMHHYKKTISPLNQATLEKQRLLIITSAFIEDNLTTKEQYFRRIERLLAESKNIPNLEIIFKLHPREKHLREYQKTLQRQGMQAKILQHISREEFYRVLQNSTAVINFGSTAGFEAILFDKPLLTIDIADLRLNPKRDTYCLLILENDAGINIPYREDLAHHLCSLLEDAGWKPQRQDFISKYCYKNDGKASERSAEIIYSSLGYKYPAALQRLARND
ncbi:MAG TPA: UDP-N-acetylglucosamine 2-epimerase [Candidatus Nanoarchaeia archaeon]|nr:UDP-N-acetylglucosamine 2-epimerase [Candidatus Nanoarchaeia archaeon]